MKKKIAFLLLTLLCMALGVQAQYDRMTNLPAIYLETFDGRSITSKDTYKYCRLYYVDENDHVTAYDSVSIRGRGNSTWNLSKKPYKIKFLNKEKFLGTGYAKAKKWTLMANAGDKTLMRNALTSAMGAFTSLKFNPAYKFVDMVLNGSYVGTYQISDQVDVRPHRVNIAEQNWPLGEDDDITGGYLLEVDGFRDGNWFQTSRYSAPIRIHYPDDEEIESRQRNYIRDYVAAFETALSGANFTDPDEGYRAYVDSASLIDWYICTEVSANIDGFFSTYFYKDRGNPHLFFGPLWDYDIAYNNDYRVRTEQGLSTSAYSLMADIAYSGSKAWVNRMWKDPWFQKTVYHRYQQLMDNGLVDYMQNKVDSFATLLNESQQLNYQVWGIDRRAYHEMIIYSSYDEYVADLKSFIDDHCNYLLQAFLERKPAEPTPPFVPGNYYYRLLNVKTMKPIDGANELVVENADDRSQESEDWYFKPVGNAFQLINRSTSMALNDPTQGDVGPTVNVGTQLNMVEPDDTDPRQQWLLLPQGEDGEGYYNLANVYTEHVANLQGGSANDGTPILSYTNDSRNAESLNRLWYIVPNGDLPDEILGIKHSEPAEYALAYNSQLQYLHFGSATPSALTFPVRVYNAGGQLVGTFTANEQFSMTGRPSGVYIVSWTADGRTRSVKFQKK